MPWFLEEIEPSKLARDLWSVSRADDQNLLGRLRKTLEVEASSEKARIEKHALCVVIQRELAARFGFRRGLTLGERFDIDELRCGHRLGDDRAAPVWPRFLDHRYFFWAGNRPSLVVAHPYDLPCKKDNAWAEQNGVTFEIGVQAESWYWPDRTYPLYLRYNELTKNIIRVSDPAKREEFSERFKPAELSFALSPHGFERLATWVAFDELAHPAWKQAVAVWSGGPNDQGLDGMINARFPTQSRIGIQAKLYSPDRLVSGTQITEFLSALELSNCHAGWYCTTSTFSDGAIARASESKTPIVLVDFRMFNEMLVRSLVIALGGARASVPSEAWSFIGSFEKNANRMLRSH